MHRIRPQLALLLLGCADVAPPEDPVVETDAPPPHETDPAETDVEPGADDSDTAPPWEPRGSLHRTTREARAPDCSTWADVAVPLPYFRLVPTPGGVDLHKCRGPVDCDDAPDADLSFADGEGGLAHLRTWAAWDDHRQQCVFFAQRTVLDPGEDDGVTVRSTQAGSSVPADQPLDTAGCFAWLEETWVPDFEQGARSCWLLTGEPHGTDEP